MAEIHQFPSATGAYHSQYTDGGFGAPDAHSHDHTSSELHRFPGISLRDLERILDDMRQQPHWRINAERDADFYDGNQLESSVVAEMEDRGMAPIITNLIKPTIDVVLGMEAKTRVDWAVRADEDEDSDVAEALNIKLREAERLAHVDRATSEAYASQVKVGVGWVEVARESDPFLAPYRVQSAHRREIWWDMRGERIDTTDWRYLVRRKWFDMDQVIQMFPNHAELIRHAINGHPQWDMQRVTNTHLIREWDIERDPSIDEVEWRDTERERLCIYEVWYRHWVRGVVLKLPDGRVVEYDEEDPRHVQAVARGWVKPRMARFSKVRLSWWIGPHRVMDMPTPYNHNRFPYIPFFGFREDRTGVPYGLVRSMKSPQEEINARRAKMMWLLSARRVIADQDAVASHNHVADEISRPDAYIILNQNRSSNSRFEVDDNSQLSDQQFQVLQEAKSNVQDAAGIYQEMLGKRGGAAQSGAAIAQLIEQGSTTLAEINDNYRMARQQVGEQLLSLVKDDLKEQEDIPVRVGRNRQERRTVYLNHPERDPLGYEIRTNDVTRARASVVLEDVPSTPTYRQHLMREMTELAKSLPPEIQSLLVDQIIEATSLPNRHELADRVRQQTGIGVNPENMTPEQQQEMQEQQEMERQERQLNLQMLQGRLAELEAKVAKQQADTELSRARAQKTSGPDSEEADARAGKTVAETARIVSDIDIEEDKHDFDMVTGLRDTLYGGNDQRPSPRS